MFYSSVSLRHPFDVYFESVHSKSGVFKQSTLSDAEKLARLSLASDAVSDVDLAAAGLRGDDQHWELLPTQAAFSVRVGSIVQGEFRLQILCLNDTSQKYFVTYYPRFSSLSNLSRMVREIQHDREEEEIDKRNCYAFFVVYQSKLWFNQIRVYSLSQD